MSKLPVLIHAEYTVSMNKVISPWVCGERFAPGRQTEDSHHQKFETPLSRPKTMSYHRIAISDP